MTGRTRWTVAFLGAVCLGACDDVTVTRGADPAASEALRRAGIEYRVTDEGVRVRSDDVAAAVGVLRGMTPLQPGFETAYATRTTLVPSPEEEHARATESVAGELARTVGAMPGVRSARVHLAEPTRAPLDAPGPTRVTASVWVQHTGPVDTDGIRRLVAGAVANVRIEDVTVVETPGVAAEVPPSTRPSFDLRRALVVSLAFNAVLAMALIASRLRAAAAFTPARKDSTG